jgi:hypothetical protein
MHRCEDGGRRTLPLASPKVVASCKLKISLKEIVSVGGLAEINF